jgi:pectate lyase
MPTHDDDTMKHMPLLRGASAAASAIALATLFVVTAAQATAPPPERSSIAAFPGAQGAGALAVGGRGGRVIEVTNLRAKGPGSLRAALEASGPRTVVFKVAGTIDMAHDPRIDVLNPYLTVAGQTAPGGGITIKNSDIQIQTHDVILRYLRIRPGKLPDRQTKAIFFREGSQRIIVDHCSVSWGADENLTLYTSTEPLRDITIQWSISSEGLTGNGKDAHGAGAIVGSEARADRVERIDLHHNLFAHNQFRNPYLKGASSQAINNLVYDWQWWAMLIRGGITVDIVGNVFKPGPNFETDDWTTRRGIRYTSPGDNGNFGTTGDPSIRVTGNLDVGVRDPAADNWPMIENTRIDFEPRPPLDRTYERLSAQARDFPITEDSAATLDALLLPAVGAGARLTAAGEWTSARDAIDARVISQVRGGTGILPKNPNAVGGYLTIPAAKGYADRDRDGMPDAWERRWGLDADDPADGPQDRDGDGFTNLEAFLAGLPDGP